MNARRTLSGMAAMLSRWADISACGRYRYTLGERWSKGPIALFVLCNPSTADVKDDDHTSRKCRGFAKRWDMAGWCILNPFALRSRHPRDLMACDDPKGLQNEAFWHKTLSAENIGRVVIGWGDALPQPLRLDAHRLVVNFSGVYKFAPLSFGTTKSGEPLHPLMLSYETSLEKYTVPPFAPAPSRTKAVRIVQRAPRGAGW